MTTDRLEELKRVVCARLSKKDRLELLPLIDSAISSTNVTACSTEHSTDSTRGTVHILKCWPEFFQATKSGKKPFEIRKNDRDYAVGDWLELHEWDPETETFTAEKPIMREVTYLLDAYGFLPPGMVCMGLAAIADQSRQVGDDANDTVKTLQSFLASSHDPDWVGNTASHDYLVTAIDTALQDQIKPVDGSTSDGYHTFDELYHHRAVLFASLCKAYPEKAWRSRKHSDGSMFGDDWFICGIATPAGQYSYHYRISKYWDMFDCCQTLDFAPEWDGHRPKDVDRVLSLQAQIKPEHTECPHCSGSGVVQEYDDLDRYHVFTCSYCEGTGEQVQSKPECCICKGKKAGDIHYQLSDEYYQINRGAAFCPNCCRELKGGE